ncbi:hypothetical protein [Nocardia terpenica]|uniref:hypothetical protein n=1 Tax=Nocardia terpenica TaxID=455432 RepID=UPI0015C57604|nr:hypothetical protein [Nocardia terpenica]NQE89019.1 hypothetical protein [Nocardia terpenica]
MTVIVAAVGAIRAPLFSCCQRVSNALLQNLFRAGTIRAESERIQIEIHSKGPLTRMFSRAKLGIRLPSGVRLFGGDRLVDATGNPVCVNLAGQLAWPLTFAIRRYR